MNPKKKWKANRLLAWFCAVAVLVTSLVLGVMAARMAS